MSEYGLRLVLHAGASLIAAVASAYHYYLAAPSAIAARPELADLSWSTALFSGRFNSWVWYHEPVIGAVLFFVFMNLIAILVWWSP